MKRLVLFLFIPAALSARDDRKVSEKYKEILKQIEAARKAKPPSTSIGEPAKAHLVNAAELPLKGYGYKIGNPGRKTHFGTDEMVFGLMALGAEMRERYGDDGDFFVGDIGVERGGKLSPHQSHQGGRDVDLGYYICDDKLRPQGNRMLTCGKDGKSKEGTLQFDLERNWTFICAVIDDAHFGEIRFILIAEWLRKLLLDYGKAKMEKTKNPREREYLEQHLKVAEKVLDVKNDHDNHFHLRIKVTKEDMKEGGRD